MNWKQFVTDYLGFTRKERVGILTILCLVLIVFLLPNILKSSGSQQLFVADTTWISKAKKLEIHDGEEKHNGYVSSENNNSFEYNRPPGNSPALSLFYFDPNKLDEAGWKKLGLRDKTIQTIQKYLGKGGHFYKPGDLKKIYGLRPEDYTRLEPYIKIESAVSENKNEERDFVKKENEPKHFSPLMIDINSADTSAFISLPGIGSKLAARIVSFREKLGGFYAVGQVGETYGLPDSTFREIKQFLKLEITALRKLNINTATLDELKAHPYIKYSIANPIISYRGEHGPFARVEDIKKVMAVTDEVYSKISPYLTTQ